MSETFESDEPIKVSKSTKTSRSPKSDIDRLLTREQYRSGQQNKIFNAMLFELKVNSLSSEYSRDILKSTNKSIEELKTSINTILREKSSQPILPDKDRNELAILDTKIQMLDQNNSKENSLVLQELRNIKFSIENGNERYSNLLNNNFGHLETSLIAQLKKLNLSGGGSSGFNLLDLFRRNPLAAAAGAGALGLGGVAGIAGGAASPDAPRRGLLSRAGSAVLSIARPLAGANLIGGALINGPSNREAGGIQRASGYLGAAAQGALVGSAGGIWGAAAGAIGGVAIQFFGEYQNELLSLAGRATDRFTELMGSVFTTTRNFLERGIRNVSDMVTGNSPANQTPVTFTPNVSPTPGGVGNGGTPENPITPERARRQQTNARMQPTESIAPLAAASELPSAGNNFEHRRRTDEEFARDFGPAAARAAAQMNVPVSTVLGHWSLESNNGRSFSGENNPFNMTATSRQSATQGGDTDGRGNPIQQRFRNYASADEAADSYASWVRRRAGNSIGQADPNTYATGLQQSGYATAPHFVGSVAHRAAAFQRIVAANPNLAAANPAPNTPINAASPPSSVTPPTDSPVITGGDNRQRNASLNTLRSQAMDTLSGEPLATRLAEISQMATVANGTHIGAGYRATAGENNVFGGLAAPSGNIPVLNGQVNVGRNGTNTNRVAPTAQAIAAMEAEIALTSERARNNNPRSAGFSENSGAEVAPLENQNVSVVAVPPIQPATNNTFTEVTRNANRTGRLIPQQQALIEPARGNIGFSEDGYAGASPINDTVATVTPEAPAATTGTIPSTTVSARRSAPRNTARARPIQGENVQPTGQQFMEPYQTTDNSQTIRDKKLGADAKESSGMMPTMDSVPLIISDVGIMIINSSIMV